MALRLTKFIRNPAHARERVATCGTTCAQYSLVLGTAALTSTMQSSVLEPAAHGTDLTMEPASPALDCTTLSRKD